MLDRPSQLPTETLVREARRLEARLIGGVARPAEIAVFVAYQSELGKRSTLEHELSNALDGVLDPRD